MSSRGRGTGRGNSGGERGGGGGANRGKPVQLKPKEQMVEEEEWRLPERKGEKANPNLIDDFPSMTSMSSLTSEITTSSMTSASAFSTSAVVKPVWGGKPVATEASGPQSSQKKELPLQTIQPKEPSIQTQTQPPAQAQSSLSEATKSGKVEDILEEKTVGLGPSQIKAEVLVKKPTQRGTLGRVIKLTTNHYRLNVKPFTVYQYDVSLERIGDENNPRREVDDDLKNKAVVKDMFQFFVNKILPPRYRDRIVYNFRKNLYTLEKLPFDDSFTYDNVIAENQKYKLILKKINEISVNPAKNTDPLAIQVMDIIMTHNFSYNFQSVNRSFFNKQNPEFINLGFGVQLWKGAYASVRPSEFGLTWNLDSANSAFYTRENVLEIASYHYDCDYQNLKQAILKDKDGTIIGASFLEQYGGREIKTATGGFRRKIKGIGPDASHKFDWKQPNGTTVKITIQDYLKQQYKINLKYPQLPCINLGKESYLPMELCDTELKTKKKLDEKETAEIIKYTAVPAEIRMKYIDTWASRSQIMQDPILKQFNINVDLRMIQLDGRVMPAPDIQYSMKSRPVASQMIGEKGSWDHRNTEFISPTVITNWVLINLDQRTRPESIDKFVDMMIRVSKIHGIKMGNPVDITNYSAFRKNENAVINDFRKFFENYSTKHKPLSLVVAVFSGTDNAYKVLKTCGDLFYGIPTQGVDQKNVFKSQEQTISNILLKINTKLGGRNFVLSQKTQHFAQYLKPLFEDRVMIFGADVTHPAPGDNKLESIASLTGSLDQDCSFYAARLYAQKSPAKQAYEMIHDLDAMFSSLMSENFRINKTYPKRIIFFRDGVSEGQFKLVLRHEMNKLRSACLKINPSYKPAITFVIVQKRHHTRFFPINQQDKSGRAGNVPPGTVVDKTIVDPELFDYFLCSHSGIQGTSRPCRYFVLHDDSKFSMDQMQLLSHYLCHIYSRCPRSVSYPAPAYYAHLAAFRGRDYIRKIQEPSK